MIDTFRRKLARSAVFVAGIGLLAWSASAPGAGAQVTSDYSIVHSFHVTDGDDPGGALIEGLDGVYGVTAGGGGSDGTLYDFNTFNVFNSFHSFGGSDGAEPTSGLTVGSDHNYYGATAGGGTNGTGTIYQVALSSKAVSPLYSFSGVNNVSANRDGAGPKSALIENGAGVFYGTAASGGSSGDGTFFSVTLAGGFTTLRSFSGPDGARPAGDLLLASDGYFYGVTVGGGDNSDGTVFRIAPSGSITTLYSFTPSGVNSGFNPECGLIQGSDGNFYGTTYSGGTGGSGTIFRITPAGVLTTLYNFAPFINFKDSINADGAQPNALVLSSDGNFYGTTAAGGTYGDGVAFQLTPNGTFTILHVFGSTPQDGANPSSALFIDQFGYFYGTTSQGGANGYGTLYRIALTPAITSASGASAIVGQPFSYQITATDDPGSFAADGLPDGLIVDTATGLISGQATQAGSYMVTLTASRASITGAAMLTIDVSAAPEPMPVITSAASAAAQVGVAFSYQIAATNMPTSFSATSLPDGLSVDAGTGLISGTPTANGSFLISLSASNTSGAGTGMLMLTIAPGTPPPPVLPIVTLAATTPTVPLGSATPGVFTLTLSAAQTSPLIINYAIKGAAINGVDYMRLPGTKKINAGLAHKPIKIFPMGDLEGATKTTVKLILLPGTGYTVGAPESAKVRILANP
jgi:uncharacterized repeat protein (TIGR03803 family)